MKPRLGLPGVEGDGAWEQIDRGTWETRRDGRGMAQRAAGINNRLAVASGVGRAHSSEDAG
jgi:hypothetical protein